MAARPQNIGIKAIEIYFPSQVGNLFYHPTSLSHPSLFPRVPGPPSRLTKKKKGGIELPPF